MASKIRLIPTNSFNAGGFGVGNNILDTVDKQDWCPVRDQFLI